MNDKQHRSGYVALIGRPNAGKSTLLNYLLQTKLVAVSSRPQTTRHRIFGIYDRDDAQIVFQDTPGLLEPDDELHRFMMREAERALADADSAVWLIDGIKGVSARDRTIAAKRLNSLSIPLFIAINKIDKVRPEYKPLLKQAALETCPIPESAIYYISALTGEGVDHLLADVIETIPFGPKLYPPEQLSDRTQRFFIEETIREKAFLLLRQELPYSLAVKIESMKERESGLYDIQASLFVERDSQKGIILGKGGNMIKQIGIEARKEIEAMLGAKVFLELWVKVSEKWRKKEDRLKEFGYRD